MINIAAVVVHVVVVVIAEILLLLLLLLIPESHIESLIEIGSETAGGSWWWVCRGIFFCYVRLSWGCDKNAFLKKFKVHSFKARDLIFWILAYNVSIYITY